MGTNGLILVVVDGCEMGRIRYVCCCWMVGLRHVAAAVAVAVAVGGGGGGIDDDDDDDISPVGLSPCRCSMVMMDDFRLYDRCR